MAICADLLHRTTCVWRLNDAPLTASPRCTLAQPIRKLTAPITANLSIGQGRPRKVSPVAAISPPASSAEVSPAAASSPAGPASAQAATLLPAAVPFLDPREGCRDSEGKMLLKNLTLSELQEWCLSIGEPVKRAVQMFRWFYGNGRWMRRLEDADDREQAFSNVFKAKIYSVANLSGCVTLQSVATAKDGTHKMVFALNSGEGSASGSVETVLIPMTNKQGQIARYTACLSTQVGCAMNCQFCYTGRMGLMGNLSTAQIVEQVVEARRFLAQQGTNMPIGNIVFMGMGEPLHNYDAVLAAIDILAVGLEISRTKIIVSSVGLVPQIRAFLATGKAKLALSLHATTDEVRDWIVPTNRRYPISELVSMLEEHYPMADARGDRFVLIEYVMLRDVNDAREDALRLAELLRGVYCMINLIVFNPHEGTQFRRSDDETVATFRSTLAAAGKVCTVRVSKGDDTMAACGQLGDLGSSPRPAPILQPPHRFAS